MFQFSGLALFRVPYLQYGGLSHSEIFGLMLVCSYPKLIAAYHVLHRLLVPRHPPCALIHFKYCYLYSINTLLVFTNLQVCLDYYLFLLSQYVKEHSKPVFTLQCIWQRYQSYPQTDYTFLLFSNLYPLWWRISESNR